MATRIITRAIQQASQTPSRLLPLLHKQSSSEPNAGQGARVLAPFLDDHSQKPWVPLGFPPHTDAGRSYGSLFLFSDRSAQSALSPQPYTQLQTQIQKLESNPSLLFKLHLQDSAPEVLWKLTDSNYLPPFSEIDEVILPSHHEDTTSPMLMSTKRTFNPSTIVRKRRHGFLARKATVGGRRILARRFLKGRRRLSA